MPTAEPLRRAHRRARLVGGALCLGTPALITGLILAGVIPPGTNPAEGPSLQLGQGFTGLVFLATAWVLWRRGLVLGRFAQMAPSARPGVLLRESILYAALFELSSLLGLGYWLLVGHHAARHVAGFLLLTPMLYLAFTPSLRRWLEAEIPGAAR
jgi:hypothetical protein